MSDRKLLGVPAMTPNFLRTLAGRLRRRSDPYQEDGLVWDVPNPFASPDPELAHLRALIQQEIMRTRRFESIAPHDLVNEDEDDYEDDYEDNADDEQDDDDTEDDDKPASIALPRLLPIPLRFIPSPSPSPPPPSPTLSSDEDTAEAEARAARKATRDAHRSRAKALAILGPEAGSAL